MRRTILPPMLIAALTLAPSTPAKAAPARCGTSDHRCQARDFGRQAAAAEDASRRALFWHASYEAYANLYEKTGDPKDLCAARKANARSLRVGEVSESQRSLYRQARAKIQARDPNISCARARNVGSAPLATQPPAPTNRVAKAPDAPAPPPAQVSPRAEPTPEQAEPLRAPPLDQAASPTRQLAPPPARPSSPSMESASRHRQSPTMMIAGGLALAAGASLGGFAVHARSRALDHYRASLALHEGVDGEPSEADRIKDQALREEFDAQRSLAIGTAIVGGATMVVGAVLLGVGARRPPRSPHAWLPTGRGLAFRARF